MSEANADPGSITSEPFAKKDAGPSEPHDDSAYGSRLAHALARELAGTTGTILRHPALLGLIGEFAMRMFVGMILGALLLTGGIYIHDSMSTSTVASGEVAQPGRTIVNWDVASSEWDALKTRTHKDWVKLTSN